MEIQRILADREETHGRFTETALITQNLKRGMRTPVVTHFNDVQREALDMICSKLARIVSGNPNEPDHWQDIAGYALLVVETLEYRPDA